MRLSFVSCVMIFVALILFALTYQISVTHAAPLWLAFISFVLGMILVFLSVCSIRIDYSDEKLEDFTDGR